MVRVDKCRKLFWDFMAGNMSAQELAEATEVTVAKQLLLFPKVKLEVIEVRGRECRIAETSS